MMTPNIRHDGGGTNCGRSIRSERPSDRIVVLNPASGSGDHTSAIESRATKHGLEVHKTTGRGDAERIAGKAANAAVSLLAIAGGDGTVHEVLTGLYNADALGEVDCAVVPTGTANFFAKSLGITGIGDAFEVIDQGVTCQIDVGLANDEPFVSTCLVGIGADANTATANESKRRLGVFAYLRTMLRLLPEYEGRPLRVTIRDKGGPDTEQWSGDVLFLLVGNAVRFPAFGRQTRANINDGRLDTTIVEKRPMSEVLHPQSLAGMVGGEELPLQQRTATEMRITHRRDGPIPYSLDGEFRSAIEIEIRVLPRRLSIYVADDYKPDPDA